MSFPLLKNLSHIVGEQLSAVVFVQDYVQLQFGGPTLNIYAPIKVRELGKEEISQGMVGWRDALCSLITKLVHQFDAAEQEFIIRFEGGASLHVPLRQDGLETVDLVKA